MKLSPGDREGRHSGLRSREFAARADLYRRRPRTIVREMVSHESLTYDEHEGSPRRDARRGLQEAGERPGRGALARKGGGSRSFADRAEPLGDGSARDG